jgi:hypothetical protein
MFGLGKKKAKKKKRNEFKKMTKEERKSFLENDMIERMIRVEQNIAKSFGKTPEYVETKVYKDLNEAQKKSFCKHMKSKPRKSFFRKAILILPLLLFGLSEFNITGNAIKDYSGFDLMPYSFAFLWVFGIIGGVFLLGVAFRGFKNRRLTRHVRFLDKLTKR